MLLNLRFSRAVLLATTAVAGSVCFSDVTHAVPYSVISSTWGYMGTTNILGTLTGTGANGGIGAAASAGAAPVSVSTYGSGTAAYTQAYAPAGPTAIYVGNSNTVSSTNIAAMVLGYTGAGSRTVTVGSAGAVVFQNGATGSSPVTEVLGTSPSKSGANTLSQTLSFGTTPYVGNGGSPSTASVPFVTANSTDKLTGSTPASGVSIAGSVANLSTLNGVAGNGGVQGVISQVSSNTSWDLTATGNAATSFGAGRSGYSTIKINGSLTTTLTLSGTRASDYVFIYLSGGISGSGQIQLATGTALKPQNVIVVIPNGITTNTLATNANTVGTYLLGGGDNLTFSDGAKLTGGVFLSNTSTATTPSELIFVGAATITPAAWNGWIMADAPEPVSMALMGTGLFGLGLARRRRKG